MFTDKKYSLRLALLLLIASCGQQDHSPSETQTPTPTLPQPQAIKTRLIDIHGPTNLSNYLDSARWNELFPNRHKEPSKSGKGVWDFFSYKEFYAACRQFPGFLGDGNAGTQKRELAAFLANIAQETGGGWPEAPGGYFKWGLYFIQERDTTHDYWDTSRKTYPPVAGRKYFGRGVLQLSGNYNYGQFSDAWFGRIDNMLENPDYVARDPALSFGSGLWFWMTPQYPKPSCHDIMTGRWHPNAGDSAKGRLPGFGATLNVINGGVECGRGPVREETSYRYQYYRYFCNYFHVTPGDHVECADQKPFGQ
jgi:hypothetical protein